MIYTAILLIALVAATVTRLWLSHRQVNHIQAHRGSVPSAFTSQIPLEKHQKAADYSTDRLLLTRYQYLFEALLLLAWTLGGGLQAVHNVIAPLELNEVAYGTLLIGSVMAISSLIDLPFKLYRTFKIEKKHGFNRMTLSLFATDQVKSFVLSLLIGAPLIALVLWLMTSAGSLWWIYTWAVLMIVSLVASWAFPTFIAPLFNKFSPLSRDDLKTDIQNLLQRSGFISKGIFVMDGSRRSSHGNAYFSGMGKNKRIVFFDTLIDSLSKEQIIAVLAHELGHFHHKHIVKHLVISALTSLIGFGVLAWLLPQQAFYNGLGVTTPSIALALLLFLFTTPLFTFFLRPLLSGLSRKNEFEADAYAAQQSSAQDLIDALVKLYEDNASTLTPDSVYSSFYDSHPPALIRIRHLQNLQTAQ